MPSSEPLSRVRASVKAVSAVISSTVDIVLEGWDASLTFRQPGTKRLRKMLKVWSERQGLPVGAQVFTYRGQEVGPADTPETLGMRVDRVEVIAVALRGGGNRAA
jgi:hypothetical protein